MKQKYKTANWTAALEERSEELLSLPWSLIYMNVCGVNYMFFLF